VSGTTVSPHLRQLTRSDRDRIEEITRAAGLFREDEIAVALEVFDDAVRAVGFGSRADPHWVATEGDPYIAMGAEMDGRLAGWICWGPTPCTMGTYDLYWMAVDPELQGQGIGSALMSEMERRLADVARLIVIETAGRPDYAPTRGFYQAQGYQPVSVIPDFYAPGDDQVVFVKSVSGRKQRER
jgi:D-alanine-D-alanine ligase